jgi:hypothetical protein
MWFAVSIAAVVIILLAVKFLAPFLSWFSQRWRFWFLKHIAYPAIKKRKFSDSITVLNALALSLYVFVNALFMGLQVRSTPQAIKLSGMMASVDCVMVTIYIVVIWV